MIRIIAQALLIFYPVFGYLKLQLLDTRYHSLGMVIGYLFYLLILTLLVEFAWKNIVKKGDIKLVNIALALITIITTSLLISLNNSQYPNFLYANYGLKIDDLKFIQIFSVFYLLLGIIVRFVRGAVSMAGLVWSIGIFSIVFVLLTSLSSFSSIRKWALSSYENKIGKQYYLYETITRHTPQNATVILPTQDDYWSTFGNQPLSRYFLYPRKLISGLYMKNGFIESLGDFYYLEITKNYNVWPFVAGGKTSFDGVNYYYLSKKILFSDNGISLVRATLK